MESPPHLSGFSALFGTKFPEAFVGKFRILFDGRSQKRLETA